jgi:hypothetical protein
VLPVDEYSMVMPGPWLMSTPCSAELAPFAYSPMFSSGAFAVP